MKTKTDIIVIEDQTLEVICSLPTYRGLTYLYSLSSSKWLIYKLMLDL